MSRKKHVLTRRQRALRQGLTLAVLILLVSLLHLYRPLPGQALQAEGDLYGLAPLQTVLTVQPEETDGPPRLGRLCLAENDGALMAATLEFRPLSGWEVTMDEVVDCTKGSSPQCGFFRPSQSAYSYAYVFGRVDDPDVKEISFRGVYRPYYGNSYEEEAVLTIRRETAVGRDGAWSFLTPLPEVFSQQLQLDLGLYAVWWSADGGEEAVLWELNG